MLSNFLHAIISLLKPAGKRREVLPDAGDGNKYFITPWTEEKIRQARAYIECNYTREISRENLAASLDISPNHLGKCFKVYTGKSIIKYIKELRIGDAAKKLRDEKEKESIITIAFSAGFESLSTFNRSFNEVVGVTPREYRKKAGRIDGLPRP